MDLIMIFKLKLCFYHIFLIFFALQCFTFSYYYIRKFIFIRNFWWIHTNKKGKMWNCILFTKNCWIFNNSRISYGLKKAKPMNRLIRLNQITQITFLTLAGSTTMIKRDRRTLINLFCSSSIHFVLQPL